MAFVGLPTPGLLCGDVIQGGFLLLSNTPAITTLADKVTWLVFPNFGVAPHQENFCFWLRSVSTLKSDFTTLGQALQTEYLPNAETASC
jgi:hypothetical protein